ncbi:MAG: F0F1 ATP synthase subunit A [Pseudomonadota bacterium]|nr:F0F1 ATP synthase subunit A [Pseudomonadota bacterium]
MAGPLEQFQIRLYEPALHVGGINVSYNTSALFMTIAVFLSCALVFLGMSGGRLVPGRWQSLVEFLYGFVRKLATDIAGEKVLPFMPILFSIFLFVLLGNLLGMIPYTFTYTSHIIVTFSLALFVFLLVTIIGFVRHGLHFLSLFVPAGVPWALAPLVIVIELVSYFARPVSLSVRLAANMLAGHMMLKIFAGFSASLGLALGVTGYLVGILPIMMNIALTGFEIFVAVLQAYVFTLLSCVYLRDALELH